MATPEPTTSETANVQRRRIPFTYSASNAYLRTCFPGHRPRYLLLSGIHNVERLYEQCAGLWPEYFSASAPYSYVDISDDKTARTKGLIGIAFYHPNIKKMVEIKPGEELSFGELRHVMSYSTTYHAEDMWREHRISVAEALWDVKLVREGRDAVWVAGDAHTVSIHRERLRERVIGEEEVREREKKE